MSEEKKQGFLFNVVSNLGNGHQVQAAFNLPEGAKKSDMDAVFDEFFGAIKRQEARLRLPTIEADVARQTALIEGVKAAVARLEETPKLNGKRSTALEAQYHQSVAQLEADTAKLNILKTSLEETKKEAEIAAA